MIEDTVCLNQFITYFPINLEFYYLASYFVKMDRCADLGVAVTAQHRRALTLPELIDETSTGLLQQGKSESLQYAIFNKSSTEIELAGDDASPWPPSIEEC